ncbi:hypothetical protein GF327_09765, partial [Candidatus Woesearchaeota archaeon]|nr:hypothetical protein [Candidatus Woesearchaeota archaeon]
MKFKKIETKKLRKKLKLLIPGIEKYLKKAGIKTSRKKITKTLMIFSFIVNILFSVFFLIKNQRILNFPLVYLLLYLFIWILLFFVILGVFWFIFLIFIDIKIKKKQKPKTPSHKNPRKKKKKDKKPKISAYRRKKRLVSYIGKAGIEIKYSKLTRLFLKFAMTITFVIFVFIIYKLWQIKPSWAYYLIVFAVIWTLGLILIFLISLLLFFFIIDLQIYNRTKKIEEVLPDFLHLTSANISAGMPIDRALWFAVRPRFGVLAKEIEDVAKATLVGEKLDDALISFTEKYDSDILKRSVNLLLEGMNSGGEVGELLNRIARNIEETRIIRKEMAANVTTYVIFILFATVIAAPFLFGLSTELIVIMQTIMGDIDVSSLSSSGGMSSMFNITGETIDLGDYQTFVITCICITSFFSTVIINII